LSLLSHIVSPTLSTLHIIHKYLLPHSYCQRASTNFFALPCTTSHVSPTFHHTLPHCQLTTVTLRPPRTLPQTCVILNRAILGHLFGFLGWVSSFWSPLRGVSKSFHCRNQVVFLGFGLPQLGISASKLTKPSTLSKHRETS
jgi:hypothetical protein